MKRESEVANLVLPKPPVPSVVRGSMLPERPEPIPRLDGEVVVEGEVSESGVSMIEEVVEDIESESESDDKQLGTITISIFENKYDVRFEGAIEGSRMELAWRAMMRQYREWKHKEFKRIEEDKKGGSK